jgi:hypothetical protein
MVIEGSRGFVPITTHRMPLHNGAPRAFAMNPSLLSDNFSNESGAATGIERTSEAWEGFEEGGLTEMVDRSNPLAHLGSYSKVPAAVI